MSGLPKTFADVRAIVDRVSFMDRRFRVLEKGDGFLLQLEYDERDVDGPPDGPPVLQRGRKWYVSAHATETEIVDTAFAAVCRSQLHVAGEHFTYDGDRVYSPHFHVGGRQLLCDQDLFDERPEARSAAPAEDLEYEDYE